jgi:hypothetical protein
MDMRKALQKGFIRRSAAALLAAGVLAAGLLGAGSGMGVRPAAADGPRPFFRISSQAVAEPDSGSTPLTFTVELSAPSAQRVSVDYATADVPAPPGGSNAVAGQDYIATRGTLVFAPGETRKTVAVQVLGDRISEGIEIFELRLANAVNADLLIDRQTGTILDNDLAPTLRINDVQVREGAGRTTAVFTVSLSGPLGNPLRLAFATRDGSAQAGRDYVATSGALTFAPGELSKQITVPVIGDLVQEPDRTFFVDLRLDQSPNAHGPSTVTSSPPGAPGTSKLVGQATIVNDDNLNLTLDRQALLGQLVGRLSLAP